MPDCIFCRIAAGEIPATIVKQDGDLVAFRDVNPQAPTHVLVIPRQHIKSVAEADNPEGEAMLGKLLRFGAQIARELGLEQSGYRLVLNTGEHGGQSVFHIHLHVLGGRRMAWPPG